MAEDQEHKADPTPHTEAAPPAEPVTPPALPAEPEPEPAPEPEMHVAPSPHVSDQAFTTRRMMTDVLIALAIIAPIFAKIIQLAASRQREYLADAGAVELTRNPEAMISALQRLGADKEVLEVANRATAHLYIVQPIKKWEERAKGMFSTHPSIEERIRRLRELME